VLQMQGIMYSRTGAGVADPSREIKPKKLFKNPLVWLNNLQATLDQSNATVLIYSLSQLFAY